MKDIKIGDVELGLKANPLALLYYRQEFQSDLVQDLVDLEDLLKDLNNQDYSNFDSVKILQIIWAMNKANNYDDNSFPSFEKWLSEFDSINFQDPIFYYDLLEEARDGFFRPQSGGEEETGTETETE